METCGIVKISPRHDKFIQSIADSPIHIIATMRGKDQYEVEKNDNGKTTVKKLGVGAKQRDGFEYEFTCTFLLDQKTNMADVQKDNTHIFEDDGSMVLTERHGEKVIEWANSGEGYTPPVRNSKPDTEIEANEINEKISQIDNLAKALGESGVSKTDIANAIKKHFVVNGKPSANYNAIKNSEVAEMVIKELESLIK